MQYLLKSKVGMMSEYMENQGRGRRQSNRDAWRAAVIVFILGGVALVAFVLALSWGNR